MSKRILDNVKTFLEKYIEVTKGTQSLVLGSAINCNEISVDPFNKDIDLHISIKAENDSDKEYFAAASQCSQSATDSRPVMGIYYLNFAWMEKTKTKEYLYFSTFVHELTHILGFSKTLFADYRRPNGTTRPIGETIGSNFKCNEKLKQLMAKIMKWSSFPKLLNTPESITIVLLLRAWYSRMTVPQVPRVLIGKKFLCHMSI